MEDNEELIREHTEQIMNHFFDNSFLDTLRSRVPTFGKASNRDQILYVDAEEEQEPVVIMPTITKLSAAGELVINFDPPQASVPDSWNALFDPIKRA